MSRRTLIGRWVGGCLVFLAMAASCREADVDSIDRLGPILAQERAQALQAERIGRAGGILAVNSGELAGFSLEIPSGALRNDAVFSVYLAEKVSEDSGYRPLGAFARVTATVDALLADAVLNMPYTDESEPDAQRIVLLSRAGQTVPVGGAVPRGLAVRGLIRSFGDFGVAADLSTRPGGDGGGTPVFRCERLDLGLTLSGAIQRSRTNALLEVGEDAAILSLGSYRGNGCGYSLGWEVAWYSVANNRVYGYSTWATATTIEWTSALPACTPRPIVAQTDSPALSEDFAIRWGSTPLELNVAALNCSTGPSRTPPRIRLKTGGGGNWAEYGLDGTFIEKNF